MPLIQKPKAAPEQEQVRFKVTKEANKAINAYAKWAGITPDYFIEEAVKMVFAKDKEWREHCKQSAA